MKTKLLSLLLFFAVSIGYSQVTSVAIVGADVGGWPTGAAGEVDALQMTSTDGENWTLANVQLIPVAVDGGLKFRANNAWTINWGSPDFPTGIATQDGPNIHGVGAVYTVTFNSVTGAFNFEGPPIPVVKLIGAAVENPDGLQMTTSDAITFTLSGATLLGGDAQFEIDGVAFGSDEAVNFPTGTLNSDTASIQTVAGVYSTVTVNINDGTYSFVAAPIFNVVSITGSAVGGWGDGFDFDMTTTDGENYTYSGLAVGVGELKFRLNNDWTVSYGGTDFPSGIATTDSPSNIPVAAAGTYSVTFNLLTGAYNFAFPVISLTGAAFGGWGDGFDFDMMTSDGVNYTMQSITSIGDEGKFRLDNQWTTSWGSADFPVGVATTDSPSNIAIPAGVYGVTFNRETGDFAFGPELATKSFNAATFRAFPNPTQNAWNFTSATENIQSIQVIDMLGKVVKTVNVNSTTAKVEASDLNSGIYFARVTTAAGTSTVKVVKN
jgi:hypothetical protein